MGRNTGFDLNPGDPPKVFVTPDRKAGVWFPQDFVPAGTDVTITDLTPLYGPGQSPLLTALDAYPSYIDITLDPKPDSVKGIPIVVVCFPDGLAPELAERLVLGHQKVPSEPGEFATYAPVPVPPALAANLACGDELNVALSLPERALRLVSDLLLPRKLHAMFFGVGGVGGSPEEFSPFGAVDPVLRVGGVGGSPEEFAPPPLGPLAQARIGAAPAGPVRRGPALGPAAGSTIGKVGEIRTTGLPVVEVETYGFDGQVNGVPWVKVTFTLEAPLVQSPASRARFCPTPLEPNGPAEVVVITDAFGRAPLPCIDFGTVRGFANLRGFADAASLGLLDPDDRSIISIVADGSDPPAPVLHFLVETTGGVPDNFTLENPPPDQATAGQPFSETATVQLRDASGAPIRQAGVRVTAVLVSGPGRLAGTLVAFTNANGVAAFPDLRIEGPAGEYVIEFVSAFPTVPGGTISIAPGPPAALELVRWPSSAAVGVPVAPAFEVRLADGFGSAAPTGGVLVEALLATGPGTLEGDRKVETDPTGVARFDNLVFAGAPGPRTLRFRAQGLPEVVSGPVAVVPGQASQLVILTQPSTPNRAGLPFTIQPVVALRDAFGNPVGGPEATVTAELVSGGGDLAGTVSVPTINGLARFTDLRVDGLVGTRSLRFRSGALTAVAAGSVAITAGPAAMLRPDLPGSGSVTTLAHDYGVGLPAFSAVSPAPRVVATDRFGNPAGAGESITWLGNTVNGASLVIGAGGQTGASGQATLGQWILGLGLNTVEARLAGSEGAVPAVFQAEAAGGADLFACRQGASRTTNLAPFSVPTPAGDVASVTLFISVDGHGPGYATYPVALTVRLNGPDGEVMSRVSGTAALPGPQAKDVSVTFRFPTLIPRQPLPGRLWFQLEVTTPPGRVPQLWYSSRARSDSPCWDSLLHPPGGGAIRGLSVLLGT